ncbi:hypothetical protein CAPTEDRAFT_187549 [Capitella teleta]|uniref:Uncharacterized protein n=1 Tax=Capitella teleta TaxID=283909 RepID=R7UDB4_CAPTE|nr:hypothetical protein CAPTEDRAFT_187549 [Capitella teleta]|eukprot:ELU04096.1 hypothetical protein CAPTEDRAFT_187549 [Capitella teleta]
MGGIGCVTPDSRRSRHTIKRSTKLVKADVTGEFDELNPRSQKLSFALDQLWMTSMIFPVANLGAPSLSWGGFMQLASKGENYERTRIEILPFINRQPTNPSSIYTALNFAREQSSLHGMETCFVTFDQPLYAKAIEIVASDEILQGVVVRLDGFHLLVSFMGSVGYIMGGSGLEVLWESVYAPASVVHMMTEYDVANFKEFKNILIEFDAVNAPKSDLDHVVIGGDSTLTLAGPILCTPLRLLISVHRV